MQSTWSLENILRLQQICKVYFSALISYALNYFCSDTDRARSALRAPRSSHLSHKSDSIQLHGTINNAREFFHGSLMSPCLRMKCAESRTIRPPTWSSPPPPLKLVSTRTRVEDGRYFFQQICQTNTSNVISNQSKRKLDQNCCRCRIPCVGSQSS